MVRKGRDFQEDIDRREKRNEEDGKPGNELHGRKRAWGRKAERAKHEVSDDIHHGCGDDLIEGVLDEATEPAPEEPLHLWNDKKWNKDRSYQHANSGGNKPIGDDHNRYGLSRGEQDGHDDVDRGSENVSPSRRVHAGLEVGNLRDDGLELCLIDL